MGPNETAIALIGAPRIISVFDVHGCHRVQIKHFLGCRSALRLPMGYVYCWLDAYTASACTWDSQRALKSLFGTFSMGQLS